jgi:serine/threonine protein kinase
MEGGRFLGSGTYGCAFTPPLLCKSDRKQRFGKVGKITSDVLAKQEIHVANRIRKVPLARNYFLLPEPESCKLAPEEVQTDPGLQTCRQDFEDHDEELRLDTMSQLIEPFGGTKPFYKLFDNQSFHPNHFDYFRFMRHILEAGSTLLLAGVCHFDLHPANMLVDKNKTVRILDFGISFTSDEINDITVNGRWKRLRFGFEADASHPSIHNSEAPELTIMNAIRRNEYTPTQAVQLVILGKSIFKDMETYLGISKQRSRESLEGFLSTSEAARSKNFVQLWKTYWPGFDAWSLGCILMDTLKASLLLPQFAEGPYKTRKTSVLAALRGLLDPNPRTRLDCIEALALFDPGNPWLSRFGWKWLQARKQQRKGKI